MVKFEERIAQALLLTHKLFVVNDKHALFKDQSQKSDNSFVMLNHGHCLVAEYRLQIDSSISDLEVFGEGVNECRSVNDFLFKLDDLQIAKEFTLSKSFHHVHN